MRITIRMDDITPDMDLEKFNRFREICDRYEIKPLIGIVPDCKDPKLHYAENNPQFYDLVKELRDKGWILAMHGCTHEYRTKKAGLFPLNRQSETAGLSYERQYELLAEGVRKLKEQGITTRIYMAPSHSYDRTTLRALNELGFLYVTDGFGKRPYIRHGLTFLPISFKQSLSLKKKQGITTFVYHVSTMQDKDFEAFERLMKTQLSHLVNYEEMKETVALKRGFLSALGEWFLAVTKFILVRIGR